MFEEVIVDLERECGEGLSAGVTISSLDILSEQRPYLCKANVLLLRASCAVTKRPSFRSP